MPRASERTIAFTPPMECLPVERLPEGDGWVFELKLDEFVGMRDDKDPRGVVREGVSP
jgi:hypothetical protein